MGNSKGSKLKKGEKGKQIHGDSTRKKKGSKPQNKMKKIQVDQKARIIIKQCMILLIKYYEVSTGKTVPCIRVKSTGEIRRPWEEVLKMLVEHFNCLQQEYQLQTQTSFMEQQELEKAEHVKQSTKLMVVEAAIIVQKMESMAKQLQDYILKEDKTDQGSKPQNKMKKVQIDGKGRILKKLCMELLIKHYEVSTGKTVPNTRVKKKAEKQRPWAEVNKMLEEDFNCLQAEHLLQTQTSFMEQQEVEKAEHLKHSTKLMVVEAAISVQKTESISKQVQDYILREDKTDQGLYPFPMDDFSNALMEDCFQNWIKEMEKLGTSSGAGTSTTMTSTGEGEYQNNGVNETFGVE